MNSDRNQYYQPGIQQFPGWQPYPTPVISGDTTNLNQLENRISILERQIKRLETRVSRLETPYSTNKTPTTYSTPESQPEGYPYPYQTSIQMM